MTPLETVREAYNSIAADYLQSRHKESEDVALLFELEARLPEGARVLDLGCGAGVPVAARLAKRFNVTGLDFSETQVELARKNVPSGQFLCADMVEADFGKAAYEAVCSYYAIIHIPRQHHKQIIEKTYRALVPGGLALLCLGANDLSEDYGEYHGKPMYWSHFDAPTSRAVVEKCGLTIIDDWYVADASYPESGHLFLLAQK